MRILFVFDSFSSFAGGSQRSTVTWFENLKKLGIPIKVLTDQNVIKFGKPITKDDVIVNKSFHLGKALGNFSLSPILLQQTKKEIKAFNPDIIHFQEQLFVSYQTLLFARKAKIKTITTFHGDSNRFKIEKFPLSLFVHEGGIFNKAFDKFSYDFLKKSDYITAPSKSFQEVIEKRIGGNVYVSYPPISKYFFQKHEYSQKITKLITVSRLAGEKRIDVLIDMMQYLKDTFSLTIVGDGIDREFLEKKAQQLQLEKAVTFLGWIDKNKLLSLLKQQDLFVSASDFETFGMTYIESLASGLPCVVYDYPTSKEVIPSGMAVFINSFDPKIWAEEIKILQDNPDAYKKLRNTIEKHYNKIYEYNEVESAKKLIEIYKTILKDKVT